MGRAAGGRREHYLVCHGVRDPSRSHETLSILGAPSTKAHNDVAALLVGRTRPRRIRPASPVLRVAASNLHENHRRRPCDWYILPPFCRRCPASNQSGKAGLRNGPSVQTPMAVNPTPMHRFSRRASLPTTKRPRYHQTCTNVVQFHFQDSSTRASSNTFSEAAPPQSRTHVSRLIAPTHQYLTQSRAPASFTRLGASRGPRREAAPLVLAPVARPRPRARRRHAPRDLMDHSRRARLVSAAPAAVVSQHRPTAPRRRGRE